MKSKLLFLVILSLLLGACNAFTSPSETPTTEALGNLALEPTETSQQTVDSTTTIPELQPTSPATTAAPSDIQPPLADLSRVDEQGAVVVKVTPGSFSNPGDTLGFEIALDTHSVDLSMDLTQLTTLKTDTGLTVNPLSWDGMTGGHHVFGNLTFPAQVDGKNLLEGAKILTLVIQNVDAPERTFTWEINQ